MCTLTYIPKKNGSIITSNRDETPLKPAIKPQTKYIHPNWITYPTDIRGGGSWIAYHKEKKSVVVLLNGAFEKHRYNPPYGHSRGWIVLNSFKFTSLKTYSEKYILENIEPFTLVRFNTSGNIEEFRWDGRDVHYKTLPNDLPHIWSSASLYNSQMQSERNEWFASFLRKSPNPSANDMWRFHFEGGQHADESYRILMNRVKIRTLSVMQIEINDQMSHRYQNLL
ncbi:MAG: NRDE family protein [Cryomorphaceae bacterium]|nr:NRDE family protein [Cryomorphaceae bacterium]